jgi:hypothetical protein
MNKHQISTGNYFYKMPDWNGFVKVIVLEENGEKKVQFRTNVYPVNIKNIPESAIFEKYENGQIHQ